MRIVTLDTRMLQPTTLAKINAVPYFGDERCERGFKSNVYNFDNKVCLIEELCYGRHKYFRQPVLSIELKQLSSLISIYNQSTNLWWVIKNRHTGREGWHTFEEFSLLVSKELKQPHLSRDWNS